jgi:hypothetical protein
MAPSPQDALGTARILRAALQQLESARQSNQSKVGNSESKIEDAAFRSIASRISSLSWLWPSWIPNGMVTILAAAPGAGKSLVALDLARRIIHGSAFPDGAPPPSPARHVLLVDAEGSLSLLRHRVEAWGINPDRLFLMLSPTHTQVFSLETAEQMMRLFNLCRDIHPALVIIDALASAAPRSESSSRAARDFLGALSVIAHQFNLAMLVIHHLRKHNPSAFDLPRRVTAADVRGRGNLIASARSVLALSPLSSAGSPADRNGPRRFEVIKSNLCPLPPSLSLTIESGSAAPALQYAPVVEAPPPPTHQDLCAQWLLGFLAAAPGPVRPADVIAVAAAAGFPEATLYRARRALGPFIRDVGNSPRDPHKRWALHESTPTVE